MLRDLVDDNLPHFDGVTLKPISTKDAAEAQNLKESATLSDKLTDELLASDILVIATPTWNFGIPTSLKAWVDLVVRPGKTFSYTNDGVLGLAKGKKAILVLASGGVFTEGSWKSWDFVEPYLRKILSFIGIDSVQTVRAEGMNIRPLADGAVPKAERAVETLALQAKVDVRTACASMPPPDAKELFMKKAKYEVFEALNPFFGVVMEGLRGIVDGDHYFDTFAEDAFFEARYHFPGWPLTIQGRANLMASFSGYGKTIKLHSGDALVVHRSRDSRVVILEYEVHGTILSNGAPYDNRLVSVVTIENRKVIHWRDYMDSLAAWTALNGAR